MNDPLVLPTSVPNLDEALCGGLPRFTCQLLAGQPGIGKTILAQQIAFGCLSSELGPVVYLTTVSEPTQKIVRFMQQFSFFDPAAFGEQIIFQNIGDVLRDVPLNGGIDHIMQIVERHKPQLLIIDSFRAIRDLRSNLDRTGERTFEPSEQLRDSFRLFCFDLASRLAAARCTTLLIGEYSRQHIADGAEFAIADGIIYLEMSDRYGERLRNLEIVKLRGSAIDLQPRPFLIDGDGIRVLANGTSDAPVRDGRTDRVGTGVAGLDRLLGGGIPGNRAVLLSGQSGSGKTTLAMQFLMEGAKLGQKGLMISVEESAPRLRELAASFGWDLEAAEKDGLITLLHIPQTDVRVVKDTERFRTLLQNHDIERICIDSVSVFLHRITEASVQREMAYRIVSMIRASGATGLLLSDVPSDDRVRFSRTGVEETVVDGIITLSMSPSDYGHRRFIQVFKMRACRHATGRKRMAITERGVEVFAERPLRTPPADPIPSLYLPPVRPLFGQSPPHGLAWLLRGSSGSGKTQLAQRVAVDGLTHNEAVLYIAADIPGYRLRTDLTARGLDVDGLTSAGFLSLVATDETPAGRDPLLDPSDPEGLLHRLSRMVAEMPRPIRIIVDSLWPIAANLSPKQFSAFVRQKNSWLRSPDVTVVDTLLDGVFDLNGDMQVANSYDIVLDLERIVRRRRGGEGSSEGSGEEETTFEVVQPASYSITLSQARGIESKTDSVSWNPE